MLKTNPSCIFILKSTVPKLSSTSRKVFFTFGWDNCFFPVRRGSEKKENLEIKYYEQVKCYLRINRKPLKC